MNDLQASDLQVTNRGHRVHARADFGDSPISIEVKYVRICPRTLSVTNIGPLQVMFMVKEKLATTQWWLISKY